MRSSRIASGQPISSTARSTWSAGSTVRALIDEGRVRELPVERITNVVGNLIYGTMFTNYFIGQAKPVEEQAKEILDIVFEASSPNRNWRMAAAGREYNASAYG